MNMGSCRHGCPSHHLKCKDCQLPVAVVGGPCHCHAVHDCHDQVRQHLCKAAGAGHNGCVGVGRRSGGGSWISREC